MDSALDATQRLPRVPAAAAGEPSAPPRPATVDADPTTEPIPRVDPHPGAHLIAGIGGVLVLYSYLLALWPVQHGDTPGLVRVVREWLNASLGIGQDFGVLGIGLLLFAAGYVAAGHAAFRRFALLGRQVLTRGYLPYVVAVAVGWLAVALRAQPLSEPTDVTASGSSWVAGLLLVDRFTGDGTPLALGWAVAAAAVFAAAFAATAVLLPRWPVLTAFLQLAAVGTVALTGTQVDGWYHELGTLATFAVLPVLGVLVWAVRDRRSGWVAAPAGVAALAVYVVADRGYDDLTGWWYPLTLVYVVLIGLLCVVRGQRLDRTRAVRWLGSRAYLTGLLACTVGYPLLGLLTDVGIPHAVALAPACVVTGVLADALHRTAAVVSR